MRFQDHFPIWDQLTLSQQQQLLDVLSFQTVKQGTLLHGAGASCTGLHLIQRGQLRAYVFSEEGREITIYRLFDGDLCLFSASCVIRNIQFDLSIEAEKDTEFWTIPASVYRRLMAESAAVANYTNELMASRFSEVMQRMEQFMWKSLDKRVAAFLLQESAIEKNCRLKITHETIARHLGSHREVITRMLQEFQREGAVQLSRGTITILDEAKLRSMRD